MWCFRFVDREAVRIGSTEEIYDDSGNNQTVHDVSNVAFQNPNGQLVVQVNKMKLCDFLQVMLVPNFGKVFYLLITSFSNLSRTKLS